MELTSLERSETANERKLRYRKVEMAKRGYHSKVDAYGLAGIVALSFVWMGAVGTTWSWTLLVLWAGLYYLNQRNQMALTEALEVLTAEYATQLDEVYRMRGELRDQRNVILDAEVAELKKCDNPKPEIICEGTNILKIIYLGEETRPD